MLFFAFSSGRPVWLWQTTFISGVQSVASCLSHSVFNFNIPWVTKQKLPLIFFLGGEVKTLCYVFIVCKAMKFVLSLLLISSKYNILKDVIWHIFLSEMYLLKCLFYFWLRFPWVAAFVSAIQSVAFHCKQSEFWRIQNLQRSHSKWVQNWFKIACNDGRVGGVVASWLVHWSLDQAFWVWALAGTLCCVLGQDS